MENVSLPQLYSFRRCPYAIRARMAMYASGVAFEIIEVSLRNKPARLVELSPKATVPVLLLPDGTVIDESLDIMRWALDQSDPRGWLDRSDRAYLCELHELHELLKANDTVFKYWLDRYKYPVRYPNESIHVPAARAKAMQALVTPLAKVLNQQQWLGGDSACFEDVAIFPFIRQFSGVEPEWFRSEVPGSVQAWLQVWLESELFMRVMQKLPAQ